MKCIITAIRPFVIVQDAYIYEDGHMITKENFTFESAETELLDIAKRYKANEIHLSGNQFFTIKLKDNILKHIKFDLENLNIIIEE